MTQNSNDHGCSEHHGLGFLKNHGRGDQDFFVKMVVVVVVVVVGEGEEIEGGVHIVGLSVKRKYMESFSLTMYGFCSSNALYSASLSFSLPFIFILTHFDT